MEKVLKDLERLGGIHHSCLVKGDELLVSTFPEVLHDNIAGACRIVSQIFMAIEGIEGNHREVFIELEENLMIGYLFSEECILVLLTEKDVNLALINTSVRSAVPTLKRELDPKYAKSAAESVPTVQAAPASVTSAAGDGTLSEAAMMAVASKLKNVLTEYVGPAAGLVFDDAYINWKTTHGLSKNKIAELIKMLAVEIDDKEDRSSFLQKAVSAVRGKSAS